MDQRYYFFGWQCTDCETKATSVKVGVSEDGKLVVVWWCQTCEQLVRASVPMEEVIAKIPRFQLQAPELTEEDESLLKGLHILWQT